MHAVGWRSFLEKRMKEMHLLNAIGRHNTTMQPTCKLTMQSYKIGIKKIPAFLTSIDKNDVPDTDLDQLQLWNQRPTSNS